MQQAFSSPLLVIVLSFPSADQGDRVTFGTHLQTCTVVGIQPVPGFRLGLIDHWMNSRGVQAESLKLSPNQTNNGKVGTMNKLGVPIKILLCLRNPAPVGG